MSACKMTNRANSNAEMAAQTFETLMSPVFTGDCGMFQPAK